MINEKEDIFTIDESQSEEELVQEALSMSQRLKRKAAMRRAAPKIKAAKKRAEKKKASTATLKKRAKARAKAIMFKKLAKKSKGSTSYAERGQIEKRLKKKKGAIDRLARKLVKQVRKDDAKK
jgi:hypothetical protein